MPHPPFSLPLSASLAHSHTLAHSVQGQEVTGHAPTTHKGWRREKKAGEKSENIRPSLQLYRRAWDKFCPRVSSFACSPSLLPPSFCAERVRHSPFSLVFLLECSGRRAECLYICPSCWKQSQLQNRLILPGCFFFFFPSWEEKEMWSEREVWNKDFFIKEWVLFCCKTCADSKLHIWLAREKSQMSPPHPHTPTPKQATSFLLFEAWIPVIHNTRSPPFLLLSHYLYLSLVLPLPLFQPLLPSSLFLACFPFSVAIMELSFSTWLTSSPAKARQEEKESKRLLRVHASVSLGEATFSRGGRGAQVSADDLLHDLKEGKKIQEANYSFPLFAFASVSPS